MRERHRKLIAEGREKIDSDVDSSEEDLLDDEELCYAIKQRKLLQRIKRAKHGLSQYVAEYLIKEVERLGKGVRVESTLRDIDYNQMQAVISKLDQL
jgi:hypothetical protein